MDHWESLRKLFPVTEQYVYMNHAGVSPLPSPCRLGMEDYLKELSCCGAAHYPRLPALILTKARQLGASLLGTVPERVFMVRSTTQGLGIVVTGLPFRKGDNIVLVDKEFPANLRPWYALKKRGVELRIISQQAGRVPLDVLAEAVDRKTVALSISYVQFLSGFRVDLAAVAEICHKYDALFVVDGIQGVGAIPIDVEKAGVDFLSADSHKWMLGPEGVGLGYASERALKRIEPAVEGWLSVRDPFDFHNMDQPLKKSAARFEEGSYNFAGIHGMVGSLDMLLGLGMDVVWRRILELTDYLAEKLQSIDWTVLSPRDRQEEKSGIILATHDRIDFDRLAKELLRRNIVASIRGGALRISLHCYNNENEIEILIKALREIIAG